MTPEIKKLLAEKSAVEVMEWMLLAAITPAQAFEAITYLYESDRPKANAALCYVYDVACYQVGGSCFEDQEPPENHSKFFISTTVGTRLAELPVVTTLYESQSAAEAAAVEVFELFKTFTTPPAPHPLAA